jgi:hypothetical protein
MMSLHMSLLDLTRFVSRTHLLKNDIPQPQLHTVHSASE